MNRVADTSFLITAFDHSDSRHRQAFEDLRQPDPIHVPPEVVAETLGVIQKRKGPDAARLLWAQLRAVPNLRFIASTDSAKVAEIFAAARRLTWVDAAVVHWCRMLDAAPLCFDTDLEKMAERKYRRAQP